MDKHKDLRIRVVHGNTLTAAVILNELPKDVKEIFLTGATSKLGRAIALYLCQRGVRVLVSFSPSMSSILINIEAAKELNGFMAIREPQVNCKFSECGIFMFMYSLDLFMVLCWCRC